jgi:type VI protein secretion system component VasA
MRADPQEELLTYFRQELTYLYRMGAEFAARYPAVAGRLGLGEGAGSDPHVQRLVESFAFLTGRIRYNLDSETPEVPAALLEVVAPHLTAPLPSLAIAQLEVDPAQGRLTSNYRVERHAPLFALTEHRLTCRFRTCYEVDLWPLEVVGAGLERATVHGPALWLRLRSVGVGLSTLDLQDLRFYLHAEPALAGALYELLFCYGRDVYAVPGTAIPPQRGAVSLPAGARLPQGALAPVGFGPLEEVLPHPPQVHPAYRLLQEFFAFPSKFHFFQLRHLDLRRLGALLTVGRWFERDLAGGEIPDRLRRVFQQRGLPLEDGATAALIEGQPGTWLIQGATPAARPLYRVRGEQGGLTVYPAVAAEQQQLEIWITLDPAAERLIGAPDSLLPLIEAGTFRLGCTPVVNLFSRTTDPVRVRATQSEYELVPDAGRLRTTEVHSVSEVRATSIQGAEGAVLAPLYGPTRAAVRANQKTFWHTRRLPAERPGLSGTSVYLSLTDRELVPGVLDVPAVYAQTLCTNRGLAETLPLGTHLALETPAPLRGISLLSRPTPQRTPPLRGAALWGLVSTLALNHLSLDTTREFAIDSSHRLAMLSGRPSLALLEAFRIQDVPLSPRATITTSTPDQAWEVADPESGATYTVVQEPGRLRVTLGQEGLEALRALLRVYATFGDQADEARVNGIVQMTCRRVVRRVPADDWIGVARGLEVTLVIDERPFLGLSPFLLATVLNQFFALYVSAGLFTQLVVKRHQVEGVWMRWPPMAGQQLLI